SAASRPGCAASPCRHPHSHRHRDPRWRPPDDQLARAVTKRRGCPRVRPKYTPVVTDGGPVPLAAVALSEFGGSVTARGDHTVLLVDDDADVSLLCRLHLEHEGFTVVSAADGKSGVAMARDHLPVAIVLDFMLPDLDGLAVFEELRADPATAAIPVVMLT